MNNSINQHGLNDNIAGDKVMGDKVTRSIQSQQNPSLAEVTKEIMQLLQQFEKINPNATANLVPFIVGLPIEILGSIGFTCANIRLTIAN